MSRSKDIINSADAKLMGCPPATQDIVLNLKNRQKCIDQANYGPANPMLEDNAYWQKKADQFKTTLPIAKTMRCSNCAAFIQKEKILRCIEKGIASQDISEEKSAEEVVDLANLGMCLLYDFKCAGDRTCDAWITGGPLLDDSVK